MTLNGTARQKPRKIERETADGPPAFKPVKHPKFWLPAILVLYLIVTLTYGAVNPLFEAPDEHWHYFTAQYIADTGELPFVAPGEEFDQWLSQEAAQPPLYYALGALLIASQDTGSPREAVWMNKFAAIGKAGVLASTNRFIHTAGEAWPWTGYSLAAHLLRGFSTLLGLGTLVCIYGSARLLWPDDHKRSIVATGLVAFLPQFNFLHSSITNDVLIVFLAAAAIWQLIRLWQSKVTRSRLLFLGLTIGLAAMTKNAGLLLLFYALGFIILLAIRGQSNHIDQEDKSENFQGISGIKLISFSVIYFFLPVVILAGWLWVRNWNLYGDFMATNQFVRFAGGDRDYSLWQVLGESDGLWLSLIAVFGWFNLRPPDWIYWFWNIVALGAILGALGAWVRRRKQVQPQVKVDGRDSWLMEISQLLQAGWILPLLLAGWVMLVYAGLLMFMMRTEAAQGRLLFPALVPLALGVAYGWTALPSLRRISAALIPLALVTTIVSLLAIRAAYDLPELVAEVPQEAVGMDVTLDQGLKLVGALLETEKAGPGDIIWMTLYWQQDGRLQEVPELVVSVFGRQMAEIGKYHGYHGRGLFPASEWPVGEIIADKVGIRLADDAAAPVLGRIFVNVVDGEASAGVGAVKIVPDKWELVSEPVLAQIGESIALTEAVVQPPSLLDPGGQIQLTVQWFTINDPGEPMTTLIHLGQPDQTPLATGDQPPLNGDYPTSAWEKGEVIRDTYSLELPSNLAPGRYPLWIGMYYSESLERLPVIVEGEAQANGVYLAGWVEVGE